MELNNNEVKSIMRELKKRRKIVWMREHEIASLFIAASVAIGEIKVAKTNLILPAIKELPNGALIDGVMYDPINGAFGIIVLHDLFPVINPGEQPEFLNGTLETKHVHAIIQGSQIMGSDLN